MKLLTKFTTGAFAFGVLAAATGAAASSFDNVNSNGLSLGKISRNIASGFVDGAAMFEAFLYLAAIFFLVMFILTMVKYKKSDGREGNVGLICIFLLASVSCISAPTLMGGGMSTLFGSDAVTTVKAPQTSSGIGN